MQTQMQYTSVTVGGETLETGPREAVHFQCLKVIMAREDRAIWYKMDILIPDKQNMCIKCWLRCRYSKYYICLPFSIYQWTYASQNNNTSIDVLEWISFTAITCLRLESYSENQPISLFTARKHVRESRCKRVRIFIHRLVLQIPSNLKRSFWFLVSASNSRRKTLQHDSSCQA